MTHTRTIVERFRTFEKERERRGGAVKRTGNANLTNRESRTKEIFLSLSLSLKRKYCLQGNLCNYSFQKK